MNADDLVNMIELGSSSKHQAELLEHMLRLADKQKDQEWTVEEEEFNPVDAKAFKKGSKTLTQISKKLIKGNK